jgi:hypothetical protein
LTFSVYSYRGLNHFERIADVDTNGFDAVQEVDVAENFEAAAGRIAWVEDSLWIDTNDGSFRCVWNEDDTLSCEAHDFALHLPSLQEIVYSIDESGSVVAPERIDLRVGQQLIVRPEAGSRGRRIQYSNETHIALESRPGPGPMVFDAVRPGRASVRIFGEVTIEVVITE